MIEWLDIKDKLPKHMQKIKVYIENPYFGSFERPEKAVFLRFENPGEFYDSEEQIHLDYVTKWCPSDD